MDQSTAQWKLFESEARTFASMLAEGADQATFDGELEVRLVLLPSTSRWAGKQATLMNHIPVGAYAVVRQSDGTRWLYTTSRGTAQIATLTRWASTRIEVFAASTYEVLRAQLEASLLEAMRHATRDGRSRRATTRGFDYEAVHTERIRNQHFQDVAAGSSRLAPVDLEDYLMWWEQQVDARVTRMLGGLPVDPDVYRIAQRVGAVERWNLITAT